MSMVLSSEVLEFWSFRPTILKVILIVDWQ